MKLKFYALILLSTLSFLCQAQKSTSETPTKNSNIIIVSSKLPDEEAFKIAGRMLVKEGYKIGKSDANFYSISTEMSQRENFSFDFGMNLSVIDGTILVRGEANSNGYKFAPYYGKGKGMIVPVVAFRFMNEFSQKLQTAIEGAMIKYGEE